MRNQRTKPCYTLCLIVQNNKDENAHRFALSGELLEREKEKERERERATNNKSN